MNVEADETLAARVMPTTIGFIARSPIAKLLNPDVLRNPR